MEGTLTDETAREAKTFAFKAPAEYASILSGSSIEAANLANNHSHDYGEKSYTDTISALEDAGIASFGYNRIKILKIKGIKVGVTGIYELADHQKRASQVKQNIKALNDPAVFRLKKSGSDHSESNRHCQKHSYDLFRKKYTNLHDSLIPYIFSIKCITSYYSCASASSLSESVFSFASLPVFNFVTVLTSLSSLYVTVTCSPSSHRITSMISATDTS